MNHKPSLDEVPTWPVYASDEREAVDAVLASGKVNYWTGEQGRKFEAEYAQYLGVKRAIALANGTVALELALRSWGIGPGDDVIVTPRSFLASTSCVVLTGARPVFADVERDSGNVSADTIERALTPRTRAIIPVHLGGWPCDMDPIRELADRHQIKVLEDCAQAHGARIRGKPVGSIGHASAFSFCQDKIITTGGEGGLLATNEEQLWARAWSFKDHGKSFDLMSLRPTSRAFRWVHTSFGTNWRMTEAQAAIGRIQLKKLEMWNERRRENAGVLIEELRSVPGLRVPVPPPHLHHAYYRFYAYVEVEQLRHGWTRDRIVDEVAARGIPCFSGSCSEIYREKAFEGTGLQPSAPLPVARELGETSLALLVHPTLERSHLARAAEALRDVMREARR